MNQMSKEEREYRLQIVQTIRSQIGRNSLFAVGASDMVYDLSKFRLMFRVRTSKRGYYKILVDYREGWDDYVVTFGQVKDAEWIVIHETVGAYCDQLETLVYDLADGVYGFEAKKAEPEAPKTETITDRHGNEVQSLF